MPVTNQVVVGEGPGDKGFSFGLFGSETQTQADRTSLDQVNRSARGIFLDLIIADYTNPTPRLEFRLQLQVKTPSGNYRTIWEQGVPVFADGNYQYLVAPGVASTGQLTEAQPLRLPLGAWRLNLDVQNGDADNHATTTVDYAYVN